MHASKKEDQVLECYNINQFAEDFAKNLDLSKIKGSKDVPFTGSEEYPGIWRLYIPSKEIKAIPENKIKQVFKRGFMISDNKDLYRYLFASYLKEKLMEDISKLPTGARGGIDKSYFTTDAFQEIFVKPAMVKFLSRDAEIKEELWARNKSLGYKKEKN